MEKFLYEMHAHTAETSRCANVRAKMAVAAFIKAGYDGAVITDHFSPSTFERLDLSWDEKVTHFLKGYRAALKAADGKIHILLGMELRFDIPNDMNDYLVYGITEEFLRSNPEILTMGLSAFSALAHENGLLIFQAHPFRIGMRITNPKLLDGVEVYNGNPRHDSSNDFAKAWAKKHGLLQSSGSDYHEREDVARGGMYFDSEIKTNGQLLAASKSGKTELKTTE